MENHVKLAMLGLFLVPMVGMFAFSALSAPVVDNPASAAAVADAGSIATAAVAVPPAVVPPAAALSWDQASPATIASLESLDAKLTESGFESLQEVKAQGVARIVGFEGQSPVRALETVLAALAKMADAYAVMSPEARRALEAQGALARIDTLLSCNIEEAREEAAMAALAAQYQICVDRMDRREAERVQENLTRKLLAREGWFNVFPFGSMRTAAAESFGDFEGFTPARESRFEPRMK
jgi:hypothetical protein